MPHFYESLPRLITVDDSVELRASSVDEGNTVAQFILDHVPHFSRWFPCATQKYSIHMVSANSSQNLVGRVSVFINPQDVFSRGYWLIPSAQGQGIMTHSLERLEQLMADIRRDSQRASNPGVEHIVLSKAIT